MKLKKAPVQSSPLSPDSVENESPRKLRWRLIGFLVFLALAITFITLGITRSGRKSEGLNDVSAPVDESVPLYQLGIDLKYYFTGSSSEIKAASSELTGVFAQAMKDSYRLFHPTEHFENWTNLAELNANIGKELTLKPELFAVLVDADERTREKSGYNLYAGALYAEWEALRYALEPELSDPLNDAGEAERLARLTEATENLDNFSLEIVSEADCRVVFRVSEEYLSLLRELELEEAPILDLNLLYDAYRLEYVAGRIEDRGFHRGYLSAKSGVTLALSEYADGEYCFYGQKNGAAVSAATVPVTPGSCAVQLRAFGQEEEAGWYELDKDGAQYLRHPYLPCDGLYRELLLSCFVCTDSCGPVELCARCLRLYACDSEDALFAGAEAAMDGGCAALLLRSGDRSTVYCAGSGLIADANYGFRAAAFPAKP